MSRLGKEYLDLWGRGVVQTRHGKRLKLVGISVVFALFDSSGGAVGWYIILEYYWKCEHINFI